MAYRNDNNDWMSSNNRAIAILRVSTKRQEEGVSHDVQEEQVAEWIERHQLELVVPSFKIAESAKDSESRKKYHEKIDWALKNNIRHILFYMGDREARNLTDNEYNEKLVLQDRIVIHYVRENKILHKNSPESDFTARDYQAVGNKDFSRRLRVKVNDAMRKKAEDGWFPNNHAPLGYIHEFPKDENGRSRKRGSIIVRDPNESTVRLVRREFELAAQGFSVASIRMQVIQEGLIQPSKAKAYSKHGIEGRLKNKFYRGTFDWQGVEYKGKHEIIIPKATLDAVDARLGGRKIRRRSTEENGIFAGGMLRCAHPDCGIQITCEIKTKKIKTTGEIKRFVYYRCSNSRGVHGTLRGVYVPEDKILKQFEPALDSIAISDQRAKEIAAAINEADQLAKKATEQEIREYEKALHGLQDRRSRLIDLYTDQKISAADYKFKTGEIDADMNHFMKLQQDAQLKITDAWKVTAETILELAKQAKELWNQGTLTEKVEILKKVCWNPILDGATLRYGLRKPFATLAEMNESEDWRAFLDEIRTLVLQRHAA